MILCFTIDSKILFAFLYWHLGIQDRGRNPSHSLLVPQDLDREADVWQGVRTLHVDDNSGDTC